MKTKSYKLRFLPLFEDDLNEITDYIANHLQNPSAALRLIDDTMEVRRLLYAKRNLDRCLM